MSMSAQDIREWLDQFEETTQVGVDEGGLTLIADTGDYLEVGGEPRRPQPPPRYVEVEED